MAKQNDGLLWVLGLAVVGGGAWWWTTQREQKQTTGPAGGRLGPPFKVGDEAHNVQTVLAKRPLHHPRASKPSHLALPEWWAYVVVYETWPKVKTDPGTWPAEVMGRVPFITADIAEAMAPTEPKVPQQARAQVAQRLVRAMKKAQHKRKQRQQQRAQALARRRVQTYPRKPRPVRRLPVRRGRA